MANIKSQKKRILIGKRNHDINASFKTRMRHAIKAVNVAVAAKNLEEAKKTLPVAEGLIDKSVKMGIQHPNTAARQKSHLMSAVAALEKAAAEVK